MIANNDWALTNHDLNHKDHQNISWRSRRDEAYELLLAMPTVGEDHEPLPGGEITVTLCKTEDFYGKDGRYLNTDTRPIASKKLRDGNKLFPHDLQNAREWGSKTLAERS